MDDWKLEAGTPQVPNRDRARRKLRWWFLRVDAPLAPEAAEAFQARLERQWGVAAQGVGTAAVAEARWYLVRSRAESIAGVRAELPGVQGLISFVEELQHPDEVKTLVQQLPLIG